MPRTQRREWRWDKRSSVNTVNSGTNKWYDLLTYSAATNKILTFKHTKAQVTFITTTATSTLTGAIFWQLRQDGVTNAELDDENTRFVWDARPIAVGAAFPQHIMMRWPRITLQDETSLVLVFHQASQSGSGLIAASATALLKSEIADL